MNNNMIYYKIRRKSDGLYSTGGMTPSFTKQGKVWHTKGAFSNHLSLVQRKTYRDCEIVLLEVNEYGIGDLNEEFEARDFRKAEKERTYRESLAELQRQREINELKRLQAKYGSEI